MPQPKAAELTARMRDLAEDARAEAAAEVNIVSLRNFKADAL